MKNRNELGSRVSLNFRNLNVELGRIIAQVAEARGAPRGINTSGAPLNPYGIILRDFIARETLSPSNFVGVSVSENVFRSTRRKIFYSPGFFENLIT